MSYLEMTASELLGRCGDDATKWAAALCEYVLERTDIVLDEAWMVSWFANAIEASCNLRLRELRAQLARLTLTEGDRELLREIRADWEINKAAVTLLDRLLASGTGET